MTVPVPSDAFHVYDTTLRDGSQGEGIVLSVNDKLAIARHLDDLGVGFVEGGWPGANPKDTAFFARARTELALRTAQLTAFGSTRRPHGNAARDLAPLRESGAGVVTLVAKADVRHVERALRTTREENLAMVRDSVAHLRAEGLRVFLDAEHFFEGHRADRAYALEVLRTAAEAGADVLVLCDTNGGMLPSQLQDAVGDVVATGLRVGIHAHDDTACAVANSLAAVEVGATHVQGTANGYGERSGNADLFSVVAALEVKLGRQVLPPGRLRELSRVAHAVAEVANTTPDPAQPWVGASAFAHKAGLHVSAVKADPDLYQHVDPAVVGASTRLLVSELARARHHRAQGPRARAGPRPRHRRPAALAAQGDGERRLQLRGGRGQLRAAAARGDGRAATRVRARVVARHRRAARGRRRRRGGLRGDGQAARAGAAHRRDGRGRRAGARARHRAAHRARAAAPGAAVAGARGLQGAHRQRRARHRRGDAGARRDERRRDRVGTVGVHENVLAASWRALEDAYTAGLLRAER